jgi:hypothetical protein
MSITSHMRTGLKNLFLSLFHYVVVVMTECMISTKSGKPSVSMDCCKLENSCALDSFLLWWQKQSDRQMEGKSMRKEDVAYLNGTGASLIAEKLKGLLEITQGRGVYFPDLSQTKYIFSSVQRGEMLSLQDAMDLLETLSELARRWGNIQKDALQKLGEAKAVQQAIDSVRDCLKEHKRDAQEMIDTLFS